MYRYDIHAYKYIYIDIYIHITDIYILCLHVYITNVYMYHIYVYNIDIRIHIQAALGGGYLRTGAEGVRDVLQEVTQVLLEKKTLLLVGYEKCACVYVGLGFRV